MMSPKADFDLVEGSQDQSLFGVRIGIEIDGKLELELKFGIDCRNLNWSRDRLEIEIGIKIQNRLQKLGLESRSIENPELE